MDKTSKSGHGVSLKKELLALIKNLAESGEISEINIARKYGQFYAPYLIKSKTGYATLFTTTSARSDRIKSNQWDAWGIKQFSNLPEIKCFLILPNELKEKEKLMFIHEKERITSKDYISKIDKILTLNELKQLICQQN